MVVDRKGRLIMVTDETKNNIIIYDRSGKLITSWGHDFPGGHGLTLFDEGGTDVLFICDPETGRVIKTTTEGKIISELPNPKSIGQYTADMAYRPTESAVAPNGDIYVADGYGSQYILQYNAKGEFIRKFGAPFFRMSRFKRIDGFLLDEEAVQLFQLASSLDNGQATVVEIGSWLGKSSVVIGTALLRKPGGRLYCVDPFDGSGDARS